MTTKEKQEAVAKVHSNHGTLHVDANGFVLWFDPFADGEVDAIAQLRSIRRFNLVEYQKVYKKLDSEYDILDLGYWYREKGATEDKYEPPEHAWRNEIRLEQKEAADG